MRAMDQADTVLLGLSVGSVRVANTLRKMPRVKRAFREGLRKIDSFTLILVHD